MHAKVILTRRTDVTDPVLSGFTAARLQLHVREARAMPELAVVLLPVEEVAADEADREAKLHAAMHTDRIAVSGGHDHIIGWLGQLAEMDAAQFHYTVELPPEAREEADEDAWACWFADRLDHPGIHFSVRICPDLARWQVGLPPTS